MNECFGKKFILNGKVESSDSFNGSVVYDGNSVYEVLRVVNGSPVFFYDHLERLKTSTRLQKKKMLADVRTLKRDIINLAEQEKRREINLKIVFNYNQDIENYLVYYIEPTYPTPEQYRKGVKGILFHAERKNPRSKVINHRLRSSIFHKLILEGAYEALLVNDQGRITEGSRTNIFFLKEDALVTAPDALVLSGITRKHILEICHENNISVSLECVDAERITDFDAVFMTGTSPRILPFYRIGDNYFNVTLPLIGNLRKLYIEKAEKSIRQFREG